MNLKNDSKDFLDSLFHKLNVLGVSLQHFEIDHLCYRTSSNQNYEDIKSKFSSLGELLIESEVGGRPIATYKLNGPIKYKDYVIDLVEVPAPKPGRQTQEGLEHIEVIIDESFENFILKYPEIDFNKKALSKDFNPELEIELDNCAVKFHHKSLEHIINIEKNHKITNFLGETKTLEIFKKFNPCISGTIPLGIETETSDLDILFSSNDSQKFLSLCNEHFSHLTGYNCYESEYQGLNAIIVNFTYNDLDIELFMQDKDSFQQQANLHFLIEGRLLKLLGSEFKEKIQLLKQRGIKTEPAFGQVLNLNQPYQDLIQLHYKSDRELIDMFKIQMIDK